MTDHSCVLVLGLLSCVVPPLIHSEIEASMGICVLGLMVPLVQGLFGMGHPLRMHSISLFIAFRSFSSLGAPSRLPMCDERGLMILNSLTMQVRHSFEARLTSHV